MLNMTKPRQGKSSFTTKKNSHGISAFTCQPCGPEFKYMTTGLGASVLATALSPIGKTHANSNDGGLVGLESFNRLSISS